jgi:uncharacterized protein (TIGR02271 family)
MVQREAVRPGMTVYSSDGEKVGKIEQCGPDLFSIEKGLFFTKNYLARYEDIQYIRGDDVVLSFDKAQLVQGPPPEGRPAVGERREAETTTARAARVTESEEQRIPLAEEQIEVEKHARQVGEVHLKKDVVTEERQFTVPVTREEVVVEHVPVQQGRESEAPRNVFREEEITVPVMEEEVEVHKRPVVKEEIRVRKESHQEELAASTTVRKEEVEVEEKGAVRRQGDKDKDFRKA